MEAGKVSSGVAVISVLALLSFSGIVGPCLFIILRKENDDEV